MYKLIRRLAVCALAAGLVWTVGLLSDRRELSREPIRFQAANADRTAYRAAVLKVREAVLESVQQDLQAVTDIRSAREYLERNLPLIEKTVSQTLARYGFPGTSTVTLCREYFAAGQYDTFGLPAGVYDTLRILIGERDSGNRQYVAFRILPLPDPQKNPENIFPSD